MGEKTDSDLLAQGKAKGGVRSCRIAYSLNNDQPVRCTYISDQPFFYADETFPLDDDDLLNDEVLQALESDIAALKHKMDAYERFSKDFNRDAAEAVETFLQDAAFITAPFAPSAESDAQDLEALLRTSRMGDALMECARSYNVRLAHSTQVETGFYDAQAHAVFVNPVLSQADQVLLAVRELRRHSQHRNGALVHPLTFHPDQAIVINRAQLADLSAMMVRVAWELQLSGNKEIWERIENSTFSDLGRAFAREAYVDFRTLNNGQAAAAVFETWFLSERCCQQDKKLIQAMLADYQGYVFAQEDASRLLSVDLIQALGEMPFGKNYLAAHTQMILADPVFTDVRDRSNANFLWFIKFERSFRDAEQDLQTQKVIHSPDSRSGITDKTTGNQDHAHGQAEIISWPKSTGRNPKNAQPLELRTGSSNVVFVSFGTTSG